MEGSIEVKDRKMDGAILRCKKCVEIVVSTLMGCGKEMEQDKMRQKRRFSEDKVTEMHKTHDTEHTIQNIN